MKPSKNSVTPGALTTATAPSVAIEVSEISRSRFRASELTLEVAWFRPVRSEIKTRQYDEFSVRSLQRDIIGVEEQ